MEDPSYGIPYDVHSPQIAIAELSIANSKSFVIVIGVLIDCERKSVIDRKIVNIFVICDVIFVIKFHFSDEIDNGQTTRGQIRLLDDSNYAVWMTLWGLDKVS